MERLDLRKRQFTQAEVLRIIPSLPVKTLQNWKFRGIIDSNKDGPGKGNRHLYSGHGIVMLSFMQRAVSRLRIDPKDAAVLAPRVAQCAQQLWDLEIDEPTTDGMREIPPLFSPTNEEYRRAFIYDDDNPELRMEIGRKDRTGSLTLREYSIVAMDLNNISILNLINRHIAGLKSVPVHISRTFDVEGPDIDRRNARIFSKILSLPVDGWDSYA